MADLPIFLIGTLYYIFAILIFNNLQITCFNCFVFYEEFYCPTIRQSILLYFRNFMNFTLGFSIFAVVVGHCNLNFKG
jgi:hypothetical protein